MYSELHRVLGMSAGPITDEMIDALIAQQTAETRGLDFKQSAPREAEIKNSDLIKDIAAMANSGGGVIIFGITDDGGKAGGRIDLSNKFDESYQRTVKRLAMTSIEPPVFGLELYVVEGNDSTVGVLVIPTSPRVPHMITGKEKFKNYLAVPVRNGPDTQYLPEAEISRMYRDRFELDRSAREQITELFERARDLTDTESIWFVGAARPKHQAATATASIVEVTSSARDASDLRQEFGYGRAVTPLSVSHSRAKRGFRSWRFSELQKRENSPRTYLSFHDDGSIQVLGTLSALYPNAKENMADASQLECYIADTVLAARAQAGRSGVSEYDILIGLTTGLGQEIELNYVGADPRTFPEDAVPIKTFIPVNQTVEVLVDDLDLKNVIYEIILDCINQSGLSRTRIFRPDSATSAE